MRVPWAFPLMRYVFSTEYLGLFGRESSTLSQRVGGVILYIKVYNIQYTGTCDQSRPDPEKPKSENKKKHWYVYSH